MRIFLAFVLIGVLQSPSAFAGERHEGPGFAPPPPQVVDAALGLPSPWHYIDSEGKANSPCLGDISTPACLYDTMVACNAWRPARGEETKGAPGYAYGPDWERGLHPFCSPLLWTPIVGYDPLGNERVVYEMGRRFLRAFPGTRKTALPEGSAVLAVSAKGGRGLEEPFDLALVV